MGICGIHFLSITVHKDLGKRMLNNFSVLRCACSYRIFSRNLIHSLGCARPFKSDKIIHTANNSLQKFLIPFSSVNISLRFIKMNEDIPNSPKVGKEQPSEEEFRNLKEECCHSSTLSSLSNEDSLPVPPNEDSSLNPSKKASEGGSDVETSTKPLAQRPSEEHESLEDSSGNITVKEAIEITAISLCKIDSMRENFPVTMSKNKQKKAIRRALRKERLRAEKEAEAKGIPYKVIFHFN